MGKNKSPPSLGQPEEEMARTRLPHVQVFVLAHNRPQLLRETLFSILSQECSEFELVVSDNSTNDDVQSLIASEFEGKLAYRRRIPSLSPIRHFQKILEEANGDYVVLFHDDDRMLPGFVPVMRDFLEQFRNYSAAASNAYLHIEDRSTKRMFYPGAMTVHEIKSGTEMAHHYLDMGIFRMPFPGYMYRTAMIRGIFMDKSEGGKHSDVSFLIKVATVAPVAWLGQPLFEYRIHRGNDSWSEDVSARLSLLRYIYRTTLISKDSSIVGNYRLAYWYLWWRGPLGKRWPWRRRVVLYFLFRYGVTLPLRQPRLVFNLLRHRFYYLF